MASIPTTYKAYRYEQWGNVEDVLQLVDIKTEPLPADQVRIQVHSVGLNPVDFKIAQIPMLIFTTSPPSAKNQYRTGFDVAGVVVEVGSDAKDTFQVGDEVYAKTRGSEFGTLEQYHSISASIVTRKPKNLNFDQAAGVPLVSLTSIQALKHHGGLKAGERVLIFGGSSGTGIFAVQYAKAIGAHVIATTSKKNAEFVKSLGADQVIDYTTQTWADVLEQHSVDVIYDTVDSEPDAWAGDAQRILKKHTGRFVTIVAMQSSDIPAKFGATHKAVLADVSSSDLEEITHLIEDGKVQSIVDSVFPFEKAAEAFTRLKTSRAVGKVIVKVL